MAYTKQTWVDGDTTKPISAARLTVIENGLGAAGQFLGSGTAFPSTGIQASDTYFRTDVGVSGSLWEYNGTRWLYADAGPLVFATQAARDAFTGVYDGLECIVGPLGRCIYIAAMPGWQYLNSWQNVVNNSAYNYGMTTTYQNLSGMGTTNVWVPPGKTLEVNFTASQINMGASSAGFLQLYLGSLSGGGVVLDGAYFSYTAATSFPCQLSGHWLNNSTTGAQGTFSIANQLVTGAMSVNSGNYGVVRLRWRIS